MANVLDEETGPVREEGREINVIAKQIPVKVGKGSKAFEIILWCLLIIPGLVFLFKKISAAKYLRQLEQKLQHDASQIDNYLEQRVVILSNLAQLVDKAVKLDQETFTAIAEARTGIVRSRDGDEMSVASAKIDAVDWQIRKTFENYPDLKAHRGIADAIQQNSYLQREITAAREQYNDTVYTWNKDIQAWPTKMIVAAKNGYTTRIPFIASKQIKEQATQVFF